MKVCKSVFVVDSDHDERVSIRRQLEAAGHFVVSASSAQDAWELLGKCSLPDLILVGRNLIQVAPENFIEQLHQYPELRKIPIAQIGKASETKLLGTTYTVDSDNLSSVIEWLNQLKSDNPNTRPG